MQDRHERAALDVGGQCVVDLGKTGVPYARLEGAMRQIEQTTLVVGADHHIAAAM
jgi:hypothetical protein